MYVCSLCFVLETQASNNGANCHYTSFSHLPWSSHGRLQVRLHWQKQFFALLWQRHDVSDDAGNKHLFMLREIGNWRRQFSIGRSVDCRSETSLIFSWFSCLWVNIAWISSSLLFFLKNVDNDMCTLCYTIFCNTGMRHICFYVLFCFAGVILRLRSSCS